MRLYGRVILPDSSCASHFDPALETFFLKNKSWDYVNFDDSEIWLVLALLSYKPSSSFFPSILAITNTHRSAHLISALFSFALVNERSETLNCSD